MLFPYMSSYQYLFNKQGMKSPLDDPWKRLGESQLAQSQPDQPGMKPWSDVASDEGSSTAGFKGYGADPDSRKRAIYSGLLGAGLQLLEAAPRGDFGGGLARAAGSFSEGYAGSRDRDRRLAAEQAAERRREAEELRQTEQERDRNESHDLNVRQSNAQIDAYADDRNQKQQLRTRTAKSADQMVADIQALAASDPKNAKLQTMARRAVGYSLGEDSDLDRLAKLHEDMTGESFVEEDFERGTNLTIGRKKSEIAAGVESDPAAAERRANRSLDLQAQGLEISRQNAQTRAAGGGGGSGKQPTTLQMYDRIEKLAKADVDQRISAAAARGDVVLPGTLAAWKEDARRKASAQIQNSLQKGMLFDSSGNLLGEMEID